jgi:multicomponent Na+:H+ antiporter subunit B
MNQNPVFRVVAKILFAPIIMFGLYVQFHGDFGPGGGFQAGVIIAAAFYFACACLWLASWASNHFGAG